MSNLALYINNLNNTNNIVYNLYKQLSNNQLIFTDKCSIAIDNSVAIFSTFYIRNLFHKYYILVDDQDINMVPSIVLPRCIVLYQNGHEQNLDDIKCYLKININDSDILKKIGDATNEKI